MKPIGILLALALMACTKKNHNDRMLAGNWEFKKVTVESFVDNEVVDQSDSTVVGVMQLQNSPEIIDGNVAWFEGFEPFGESYSYWEISNGKARTINFYRNDPDAGVNFSYSFNIEKVNGRKLILTIYLSDNEVNILKKTTYELIKK